MDKTFVIKLSDHKVPEFKEERSKKWVIYGAKGDYRNRYPDYLLNLYNSSAKHHAIINGKTDYIYGNGFRIDESGLNMENVAILNEFVSSPNRDESLNEILAKCVLDFEIYNGFALEIIYNQTNEKIAAIHHAEFKQYRKSKDGDFYFYSDDWSKGQPTVEVIDAFDYNRPKGKQLLYVKAYHPMAQAYPLPGYLGCIPYIEVDREIANYQLNAIKNNFQAGKMINFFNGQPSQEEQGVIERKLEDKFTGTDNANSFILNFNDSKEQGAEVINLDGNDFADRYQILEKTTQQNIFTGHRVTSGELFGVKEEGIFSTRNQLRDAYELFQNTYVNNRQEQVLAVFNGLAEIQGFVGRLDIMDTEPIGVEFSEQTKVSVMTTDEIREEIGLEPLPKAEAMAKESEDDNSEFRVTEAFAACGESVNDDSIIWRRQVDFSSDKAVEVSEDIIRRFGFGTEAFDMAVLDLLKKDPTLSWEAIALQMETTADKVLQAVRNLAALDYLNVAVDKVIDSTQKVTEVTRKGTNALETAEPLDVALEIGYRYTKRAEASGADKIPTTRDFCSKMLAASKGKYWKSDQIQQIGMQVNRNVWQRMGGWWTRGERDAGTGITTPYCRHTWEQIVVNPKKDKQATTPSGLK